MDGIYKNLSHKLLCRVSCRRTWSIRTICLRKSGQIKKVRTNCIGSVNATTFFIVFATLKSALLLWIFYFGFLNWNLSKWIQKFRCHVQIFLNFGAHLVPLQYAKVFPSQYKCRPFKCTSNFFRPTHSFLSEKAAKKACIIKRWNESISNSEIWLRRLHIHWQLQFWGRLLENYFIRKLS